MKNIEFFYDKYFSNAMISTYINVLLPLGFPSPRPVKFVPMKILFNENKITFESFKRSIGGFFKASKKGHEYLKFSTNKLSKLEKISNKTNRQKSSILKSRVFLYFCEFTPLSLNFLGEELGFSEEFLNLLQFHSKRTDYVRTITDIAYIHIYLPILGIYMFISVFLLYFNPPSLIHSFLVGNPFFYILYIPFLLLVSLIPALLFTRILFYYYERNFADSACVQEIIYILYDLLREDILTSSKRKSLLLARIEYLAQITTFIPHQYKFKAKTHHIWTDMHFELISFYIKEHGRWLISPSDNTLNDLRQDFKKLSDMFILGTYGEFNWNVIPNWNDILIKPKISWKKNIVDNLLRLLGIAIPLVLMGLYISLPEDLKGKLFPGVTVPSDNVAYVFFAWLLITIDLTLKLGVVESVIGFAKGLNSLSK